MTKKMKIILGLVVAAGVVAGAISYKNANTTSPEIQEVEEAEKLNPCLLYTSPSPRDA